MATVAELMVKFNGDISGLKKAVLGATGELQSMSQKALSGSQFLAAGLLAVGAAAGVLGGKALSLAMDMEQTEVAFKTLLGSGEAAEKMMKDLNAFAATTPFQFPELAKGAKLLAAFGVETDQIIPSMQRLGDVSAGIGAPIAEIAEIYGKAKVQGRLFMEDINQLTGRGIPIIGELAKQFGVTESEIRELVSSGQVNFGHLEQAFVDLSSEGGQFYGMMEAQSQTLGGLWSTVKDNVTLSLAGIGTALMEAFDLKDRAKALIENLQIITERITAFAELVAEVGIKEALSELFSEETKIKIMVIGGAILGALVPAAYAAAAAFVAMMIPLLPFIVAGAVLGALAYLIYKQWDFLKGFFTNFWSTITGKWDETKAWFIGLWTSVKDFFVNVWNEIKSIFTGAGKDSESIIIRFYTAIFDFIKNTFNAVRNFFSEIWGRVKEVFNMSLTDIWDLIKRMFFAYVDFVINFGPNVVNAVKGIWETVNDYMGGLPSRMVQYGRDMITGLIDGIKNMAGNLVGAIKNVVSGAVTAAKNFLGIKSPSKLFEGIGMNIGAGLEQGIEKMKNSVSLSVDNLVGLPQLAIAGGSSMGGDSLVNSSVSSSTSQGSQTFIVELDSKQIGRATFKHLPGEVRIKTGLRN